MKKIWFIITTVLVAAMCIVLWKLARDGKPTDLAIIVWPTFPPVTNSYRHLEHIEMLRQQATAIAATNRTIFRDRDGALPANSPLRPLLGIPTQEPAKVSSSYSSLGEHSIRVYSARGRQSFGRIGINSANGTIYSVYDVQALFTSSELARRVRRVVPTREKALDLFKDMPIDPRERSAETQQALAALAEALFLNRGTELHVQMSAPGGTNRRTGYLHIVGIISNSVERVAEVVYAGDPGVLGFLVGEPPSGSFEGLRFFPMWTNLNTHFLLDSEGVPYPRAP